MGAIWGVHLVASALKRRQRRPVDRRTPPARKAALAWYATELVGRAAERYLLQGKSWGDKAPSARGRRDRRSLDRDSILRESRSAIMARHAYHGW
jgi:hypothetical protein